MRRLYSVCVMSTQVRLKPTDMHGASCPTEPTTRFLLSDGLKPYRTKASPDSILSTPKPLRSYALVLYFSISRDDAGRLRCYRPSVKQGECEPARLEPPKTPCQLESEQHNAH
jgi:hypothetical protein